MSLFTHNLFIYHFGHNLYILLILNLFILKMFTKKKMVDQDHNQGEKNISENYRGEKDKQPFKYILGDLMRKK